MRHQRILAFVPLTVLFLLLCLHRRDAMLSPWTSQVAQFLESASALHSSFVQPRCGRLACNQNSCERLAGNKTLQWSPEYAKCEPDFCGGAALPDIPGFEGGRVPAKLACSLRHGLLDTRRARQCLANKRVLLLGDSTMVEMAHDLNMLLAGVGGNASAVDEYCLQGTRMPYTEVTHLQIGGPTALGLNITFLNAHFHMLVATAHDNIHIINKFTGYWDAPTIDGHRHLSNETDASFGVAAFADPGFQPQLACLLGEDPACPAPDVVLVNSGIWDQVHHRNTKKTNTFEPIAAALGRRLAALPVKAYWVGTRVVHAWRPDFQGFLGFDAIAAAVLPAAGVPFISIAPTMRIFMPEAGDISDSRPWSADGVHYGATARYDGYNNSLALSSAILQTVLNAVC